jgi:MFS transporter, DHA2 family, multidrug resistance protein
VALRTNRHEVVLAQPVPVKSTREPIAITRWIGFLALCIGMFMAILDIQIVATSLPAIQGALQIAPDAMSWLQTSYLIAEVIAIPLSGVLTRALSIRGLFLASAMLFLAASVGCGMSTDFNSLVAWRVVQGFAGGALIPLVFSAAFLLFPGRGQALATMLAGMLAVLAPTVGPLIGGWITTTWGWPWLFFVNVGPGLLALMAGALCLPGTTTVLQRFRWLDGLALAMLAVALAALEIGLKGAPKLGWQAPTTLALMVGTASAGCLFVWLSLRSTSPIIDLRLLRDRAFRLGCAMSFVLGIGLYGNVYLMPVFLAYVGGLDALEIGQIMLVTGAAQLLAAPVVVALERVVSASRLSLFGFVLFAAGLAMSGWDTPRTEGDEMFWPQIARGVAIMFCLLPPTRVALGHLSPEHLPDGSAVFNLMRNLGGAIGLALIDTIIFGRAQGYGDVLATRLLGLDPAAFAWVGLPLQQAGAIITPEMKEMARPAVERAALTLAINDAWLIVAAITLVGAAVSALLAFRPLTAAPKSH